MVDIASFDVAPSRAAQLGQQTGAGLAQTLVPAFQQRQQSLQLQQQLDPIRQALIQSLGTGPASTPGQALVQSLTQSPELFASAMSDPQQLQSLLNVQSLAAPAPEGTGFETLDEINKTFDLARRAREAGEPRRAEILQNRLNDLTGGNVNLELDIVHRIPAGSQDIQTIQSDGQGGFFDLQGQEITLDNGDRILESFSIADTAEGALSSTEQRTLNDAEVSTRNFLGTASDALTLLATEPNVNTLTGRAASLFNDLQAEARAVAENFGLEFDTDQLDPSTHDSQFDRLGVQNARQRSLITSLAFQAAAAAAPGDRVTERDIQRFIEEVGGSANDPVTFRAVLTDLSNRMVRNMNNQIRVRLRPTNFEVSDFGLGELPGFTVTGQESAAAAAAPGSAEAQQQTTETFDFSNATNEDLLDF